jgi:predicted RNA-binding protein
LTILLVVSIEQIGAVVKMPDLLGDDRYLSGQLVDDMYLSGQLVEYSLAPDTMDVQCPRPTLASISSPP